MSIAITTDDAINTLMEGRSTAIAKDLKLNLKRVMTDGALDEEETHIALLAIATSLKHGYFINYAKDKLLELGVADELIEEAAESAALTGMLNVYYRFRHFVESAQGEVAKERYKRTGLRMNSMSKPLLGHERFEMLAFAVSVINGCEMCVNGHEKRLLDLNVDAEKIHDLARLAALVKAVNDLA